MKRSTRTFLMKDPIRLKRHLPEITGLADSEKEALGFLPHAAFEDAVEQKRLIAMLTEAADGQCSVVGYILFGGVYPHARVQQLCTTTRWRRHKIASALIDALVSHLEAIGYLSIKANVAADLTHAQAFYGKHGFEPVVSKRGGAARGRTIVVRVRNLDTPHLFSAHPAGDIDFALPPRIGHEAPFYTFDLNVFFDLVRNRERHTAACALFGAALKHHIRLGIAPEFVNELRRTTSGPSNDPVLQMALQLPRLPPATDPKALEDLTDSIHRLVFIEKNAAGAGSSQAKSDSKHLAHSALSRISGFITSDKALLAARDELFAKIGIDVASLHELIALLPDDAGQLEQHSQKGLGFECGAPDVDEARLYLEKAGVADKLTGEFFSDDPARAGIWRHAIREGNTIVALACLAPSSAVEGENRLLIYVEPGHLERELYADYLLDASVRQACATMPGAIRLLHVAGQSTVLSLAKARGFVSAGQGSDLVKVAIGRPLTRTNWEEIQRQIRRRTGVTLPALWHDHSRASSGITITGASGKSFVVPRERMDDLFGPTIFLWPGREGVIVPIQRSYADELLGTNMQVQLPFIENRDAAFFSRRAYVNTPRARGAMRPGLSIFFYESGKNGGRGAVVAGGRIVDSVLVHKDQAPGDKLRRVVIENIGDFSASDDVLLTTFDNLLVFPTPVPFTELQKIDAVGRANLISATSLSHDQVARIFEAGWANGRT